MTKKIKKRTLTYRRVEWLINTDPELTFEQAINKCLSKLKFVRNTKVCKEHYCSYT